MLNEIILQGRLTRNPEMKATASGISCATFGLACERDYKATNGERETDFFEVVAWRNTAEFVQTYFSEGRMVIVRGRLQNRNWTAEDGTKRTAVQVVAYGLYFSDSQPKNNQAQEQPAAPVEDAGYTPVVTDELPF